MTTDDTSKTDDGSLKYTSQQRAFESGLYKFRNILEKRKPDEIEELEHRMCSANSRTVRLDRFLDYLRVRYSVEERLYEFYSNKLYRIYRMWSYNRKGKSESKLVKRIKEKFDLDGNGTNIVLAYGNWKETRQMKGCQPSPTTGIKRTLMQHFKVVDSARVQYNHYMQ